MIRLVPRHSVDEYVLDRASKKLTLDRLVMHRRKFKGTDPFQEVITSPLLLFLSWVVEETTPPSWW